MVEILSYDQRKSILAKKSGPNPGLGNKGLRELKAKMEKETMPPIFEVVITKLSPLS